MISPDIKPGMLIARIAEIPHSGPTVATFRHFANPRTYEVDIEDLGNDQIYFGVKARPVGRLFRSMDLLLSVDPNGPNVGLQVSKREVGAQRYPRLQYKTGWDIVTPDQQPNGVVYKFQRSVRMEGVFDPISAEGLWLLEVMEYFNQVSVSLPGERGINPRPRVLTHDQCEAEWAQASKRFLAALGAA